VPIFVLIVLLFLGGIGYLAQLNPDRIVFFLSRQQSFDLSVMTLVLFSAAAGGLLVLLAVGLREARSFLVNWKEGRRQRKTTKVAALYDDAVNASLSLRDRDAIGLFQKILALDPHHVGALLRLGNLYRQDKRALDAIRLHKAARSVAEENIEVLFALAADMEASERNEEAAQYLKEIIALDRQNLTAQARLRDLYVQSKSWEEAHAVQEQIVKLPLPDDRRAAEQTYLLGLKYEIGQACENDPDRARRYFKEVVKIDKMFLPPYVGMAEISIRQGKPERAVRLLERGYDITGRLTLLHRLEDLYIEMGTPDRMLQFYRRILATRADDLVLKFYLGKFYYRLEMIDEAYAILSEVAFNVDTFPDLYKIVGNIHLRRGDLAAAVDAFKTGLKIDKKILVTYYCPACDDHSTQWSGRCGRCGRWDSYRATPIFTPRADRAAPTPY